jgi:hypothetical protein
MYCKFAFQFQDSSEHCGGRSGGGISHGKDNPDVPPEMSLRQMRMPDV